eukprot:8779867-Pyramimonas_sp.AAC.1
MSFDNSSGSTVSHFATEPQRLAKGLRILAKPRRGELHILLLHHVSHALDLLHNTHHDGRSDDLIIMIVPGVTTAITHSKYVPRWCRVVELDVENVQALHEALHQSGEVEASTTTRNVPVKALIPGVSIVKSKSM